MLLPPPSAPIATGWSDICRAGFAPAEEWCLLTAHGRVERRRVAGLLSYPKDACSYRHPAIIILSRSQLIRDLSLTASALGLQSILGLGSYRTAWALLHKLRRAMVRPGRERLSGRVEVDETYVGGAEEGLRGRQTQKKALVAIAAEEDGAGIGRIRMKRIRGASKQQLHGFIQEAVEPDSTIHTDSWEGYVGLEALGYRHEYDFLAGSSQSASELLPHVHRVAALLKRWLIGTHQGAVSREHLDYYLDEYTFRFNRRRSRHRGKLFYRLVQQAATVGPTTYSEMVQHLRGRRTGQPQDVG